MDQSKIRRERSKTRENLQQNDDQFDHTGIQGVFFDGRKIILRHKFLASAPLPHKYHHGRTQTSSQSQSQFLRTFEFVLHFVGCDTVTLLPNQITIIIIIIILQRHIHLVKSRYLSAKYTRR